MEAFPTGIPHPRAASSRGCRTKAALLHPGCRGRDRAGGGAQPLSPAPTSVSHLRMLYRGGRKSLAKGGKGTDFFFFKSHAHTIRKLNQNLKNRQDSGQVAVNASRAAAPAPGGLRAWGPGCWREQPARPRGRRRSGGGGRAGGGAAPCELAERREAGSALVRFPLAPGASSRARLGNPRGNGKQD